MAETARMIVSFPPFLTRCLEHSHDKTEANHFTITAPYLIIAYRTPLTSRHTYTLLKSLQIFAGQEGWARAETCNIIFSISIYSAK